MFKKWSTAASRQISSSPPSIHQIVWLAPQSLCCFTHRLSSSVHGDYLLPSKGPVLFALYNLLLERNSLLLTMPLLNLLTPVAICFQESTCIELWKQPCQYAIYRARRLHDSCHTQLPPKFASLSNGKTGIWEGFTCLATEQMTTMARAIMARKWTFSVNIGNDFKACWWDYNEDFDARYATHNTTSSIVSAFSH